MVSSWIEHTKFYDAIISPASNRAVGKLFVKRARYCNQVDYSRYSTLIASMKIATQTFTQTFFTEHEHSYTAAYLNIDHMYNELFSFRKFSINA